MQTILVAGVLNQPYGSWPAASQSDDGITWSDITRPFDVGDFCTALATNGGVVAVANQRGYLATTTDMVTWSHTEINDGFGTVGLGQARDHNGHDHWLAVGSYNYINGYGPYPAFSEVAQIYRSNRADLGWAMVWTSNNNNSLLYQVAYFKSAPISNSETADVWVAVGNNGSNRGEIIYSLDYGLSWAAAAVPQGVEIIYSTALYQRAGQLVWYWGCKGRLFITNSLHDTVWEEVSLDAEDTAVSITVNSTGAMVVTGVNRLYITLNGLVFSKFSVSGYVFNGVTVFDYDNGSRWLAWARSGLNQWTMWYTDNLLSWEPWNNGIEVQGSTVNA